MQIVDPINDVKVVYEIPPTSTPEEIKAAYESKNEDQIVHALLKGRWVTHNILSPAACFDPAARQGFESFLASMDYLIYYNVFIVGHENSNVSRFLARALFAKNQLNPAVKRMGTDAYHVDVGDNFNF